MKQWKWYLLFFGVLLTVFYFVVFRYTDIRQSRLPVINANTQPFAFTNQNGQTITQRHTDGKVYVAEFFFTTCKGICPRMNANMRRVYDEFKADSGFLILSHTCMPETDSVPLMKKYEQMILSAQLAKNNDGTYKIEPVENAAAVQQQQWQFLTGDKRTLYGMARHSYMIDENKTDTLAAIEDQFIHTQFFSLVDKQGRVRGIYDGLKENEIQKLLRDVKDLLAETSQTRSLVN
jgi:protein SCO1/2